MKIKNLYSVLFSFLLVSAVLFSGSFFWHDGVIVRGPEINSALTEKMDVANATYFQLAPQANFATQTAEIGTVYMNASGNLNYLSTGTTWLTLTATTTGLVW
jgi:hypothetical protein